MLLCVYQPNITNMRFLLALVLFWTASNPLFAQNRVMNGSFEVDTVLCDGWAQGWIPLAGDVDVMKACNGRVPMNEFGFQNAFDGDSYLKVTTSANVPASQYREYVGTILTTPIDSGDVVTASMWTSHGEADSLYTSGLGMWFGADSFIHTDTVPIMGGLPPFCFFWFIPDNDTGWVEISCMFTAPQDFDRIVIGNFFDNSNTLFFGPDDTAVYFVDSVSVTVSPMMSNSPPEVVPKHREELISIYDLTGKEVDETLKGLQFRVYRVGDAYLTRKVFVQ